MSNANETAANASSPSLLQAGISPGEARGEGSSVVDSAPGELLPRSQAKATRSVRLSGGTSSRSAPSSSSTRPKRSAASA